MAVLRKWQGYSKLDGILRTERNQFHGHHPVQKELKAEGVRKVRFYAPGIPLRFLQHNLSRSFCHKLLPVSSRPRSVMRM